MPEAANKVTVVRPDGTLLDATPDEAQRLSLLGYKPITAEQNEARLTSEARSDYYTSPGAQVSAGLEGLLAGATFGGSDYVLGATGNEEDLKARAQYNPGIRMASEMLGAIAPMLISGGAAAGEEANIAAKAARFSPTSLLSEGARLLAPGAEGSLTKAVTAAALEGGVYGGAGSIDHAYLDDSPITAESVLHGIGWGALMGGAFGAVGHGIEARGEAARAAIERDAAAERAANTPTPVGALKDTAGAEFDALRSEVKNLSEAAKASVATADSAVESTLRAITEGGEARDLSSLGLSRPVFRGMVEDAEEAYAAAKKAVNANKFDVAQEAAVKYADTVNGIAERIGTPMPDAIKPLKELIETRATAAHLSAFPDTVEGFAKLSGQKAERVLAALEQAKTLPIPSSLKEAAEKFSEALGVKTGEETGLGLRATQKSARALLDTEGKLPKPAKPTSEPHEGPSLTRKVVGYAAGGKAYLAARAAGLGKAGGYAAYRGVRDAITYGSHDLTALRGKIVAEVNKAVASFAPKIGQTIRTSAGPGALAITLTGDVDKSTTDKQKLAANRAAEIAAAAPTIKDKLYKAVEPLSTFQPILAPTLHKTALQAFQALQIMAPKDTGALNAMQSLWKPSQVQAAILEKQLAVFHDPIGQAKEMLDSGAFDATKIMALQQFAPATWQQMRVGMMQRLSEPGVAASLTYNQQIGISTLLDLPIHTSMDPAYIATSQQMYMDRSAPLKAKPRAGQGGGLPNPKDNVYATDAQRIEAH